MATLEIPDEIYETLAERFELCLGDLGSRALHRRSYERAVEIRDDARAADR